MTHTIRLPRFSHWGPSYAIKFTREAAGWRVLYHGNGSGSVGSPAQVVRLARDFVRSCESALEIECRREAMRVAGTLESHDEHRRNEHRQRADAFVDRRESRFAATRAAMHSLGISE